MTPFSLGILGLVVARWLAQLGLEGLNQRHVRTHVAAVPESARDFIDPATYSKSVSYTLAKSRLNQLEATQEALLLGALLWSGVLPWVYAATTGAWGESAWALAAFLYLVALALAIAGLPLDWYAQFRVEERFGFNTTTGRLWWLDRLKGLGLSSLLGYGLLVAVLKLAAWAGAAWWIWAWACVVGFEVLLGVLAPVLILPLFNKFTPLPEGSLRARLLELARRTGFRTKSIQVMDGSKRSRHSNAFFTGLGRFRKIVLFDTLLAQLNEPELEAVLAHEIAHWKKKHVPKLLAAAALGLLVGFYALAWLAHQDWFYRAFGFAPGPLAPAFLLFGLLAGLGSFWLRPLLNAWSRRYEYEADAFAARSLGRGTALVAALRKLTEKNLSNLTPHPLYSRFCYSHPTLPDREKALGTLN